MTLVEFILARLAEIERPAEEAHRYEHDALRFASALHALESIDAGMGRRFANQSPAYVLADIAAKRRIVEGPNGGTGPDHHDEWDETLRSLALPFAAHPDYDPAWRPS